MAKYKNPRAFKQALTDRLKKRAKERGILFNRYRQLVLFDRFLARVYEACGEAVILKGGYLMELRLNRARTTKDIDMRGTGEIDDILELITEEAKREGQDFLSFEVAGGRDLEEMVGEQIVYEGRRVRVQAQLGGLEYGDPFGLDLSMADALALPPENVPGDDFFEFIDLEPVQHRVYPKEAHVAEKLHAISYEFEDGRINGRAKDLVDIGLLASNFDFHADDLIASIEATFTFRDTHALPNAVPEPPRGWDVLYEKIRQTDKVEWRTVNELHAMVSGFLNPVLVGKSDAGSWRHSSAEWIPVAEGDD